MNLVYVDKLADDNSGLKYLLVRQHLLDKTRDGNGMKTKRSTEEVRAILTMITKKNRPKESLVDRGTDFGGDV